MESKKKSVGNFCLACPNKIFVISRIEKVNTGSQTINEGQNKYATESEF